MSFAAFLGALGLLVAAEGLLYAAFPATVRRALAALLALPEAQMRGLGFAAAGLGLTLLAVASLLA